jgi:hypothetical protein
VGQLVRDTAVEVVGFDRRLWSTLRDLILRPAQVVLAHLGARAHDYVHPLRLFLFLGGLYMLLLSWVQPFTFSPDTLRQSGLSEERAAELTALMARHGLTVEVVDARYQDRMNATVPLTTALALVPMALLLGLMHRGRPFREHLTFLLVMSNAVWLLSLLILPLAPVNRALHGLAATVLVYIYLGIGYFAVYGSESRARTAGRFALFAIVDLIVSALLGLLLGIAVFVSVIYL